MKNNFRIFGISLFVAFLTVYIFSVLGGEIATLGLFPGFMINWFIEQLLIEIRNEPYFMLGDYSFVLNCISYFTVFFFSLKILLITSSYLGRNESQRLK
jgi:hypothetical protein